MDLTALAFLKRTLNEHQYLIIIWSITIIPKIRITDVHLFKRVVYTDC